uniref:Interference hedgehog n=1 Tax=Culicoides sonorensis TaxID=179676 RepID=A0A336MD34_CULSO
MSAEQQPLLYPQITPVDPHLVSPPPEQTPVLENANMTSFKLSTRISTKFVNRSLVLLILFLTQILQQSSCLTSSSSNSRFGVHMIRSPESNIAPRGDEVQFECELNLEPDRLEWRFLPQDRLGDSKNDYIYMNSNNGYNVTLKERVSRLTVVVSHQNVGEYQCIAWIGASALASLPAKLSLASISLSESGKNRQLSSTRRGSQQQQQITWRVSPGNSVIIKCGEVISFPAPVWTFYKDTVAVPSSVPQLPSGALILSPVTQRDSGTYYCSAVNSITGTDLRTQQNTTLIVDFLQRSAPSFLSTVPKNFVAKPGSSIILECPGVGNPVPKSIWSRPDKDIPKSRVIYLPYGLEIHNINDDDQGAYTCTLDNGIAPTLIHKMYLTVLEPPEIIEPPKASLINEGESLELECLAVGSPEPTIHWMINGDDTKWDPLVKSNGNKLYIKSVEKRHAGIVQCFASNEAGEETASNSLHVTPKQIPGGSDSTTLGLALTTTKAVNDHPGKINRGKKKHKRPEMVPPSKPFVTRLNDENVMVRWSVPSNDGLPIQFFKVQYRTLSDPERNIQRTSWMTANEDIPPHVTSYEVEGLKPDRYYRFRIAAVYSNNDNKLGPTSGRFHLQRGEKLGAAKSHLPAPVLSRIEPISETEVMLYWDMLEHSSNIEGFYAYYRPSTSAGEYSKATVLDHHARSFKIDHLEPGTAYEFKLQSFTASAASDFSAILTKKTLKPATVEPPFTPTVIAASEQAKASFDILPWVGVIGIAMLIISLLFGLICICKKSRNSMDNTIENKSHPDIIQSESNGFTGSPLHKNSRMNGHAIAPRMTITANPLAQESDKVR